MTRFKSGDWVEHRQYGLGRVIDAWSQVVEVQFPGRSYILGRNEFRLAKLCSDCYTPIVSHEVLCD